MSFKTAQNVPGITFLSGHIIPLFQQVKVVIVGLWTIQNMFMKLGGARVVLCNLPYDTKLSFLCVFTGAVETQTEIQKDARSEF